MNNIRVRQLGPNQTEVVIGPVTMFFSYETMVAAYVEGKGFYRTAQRYSVTTSRHVNNFLGKAAPRVLNQEELEKFVEREVALYARAGGAWRYELEAAK